MPGDTQPQKLQITAIGIADAAKVLASAYGQKVTEDQVRHVVEEAAILRADGTFSLIDYVAYLAREVSDGQSPRQD